MLYAADRGYGGASDHGGVLDRSRGVRRVYRGVVSRLSNTFIGRKKFSSVDAIA